MSGVISTRNGVPPEATTASDPPGGVPRHPDPDPKPHPAPDEGMPGRTVPEQGELPNEPPQVPPRREAHSNGNHRSHHKHK